MKALELFISRHRATLFFAGVLIIAFIIYRLLFASPVSECIGTYKQLQVDRRKVGKMANILKQRPYIESIYQDYAHRMHAAGSDAQEIGHLLKEIEALTRSKTADIKTIKAFPLQHVGAYRKFMVSMEVQGRIQSVLELLYAIENSPGLLKIESLKLQALRTGPNLVTANIMVAKMATLGEKTSDPNSVN